MTKLCRGPCGLEKSEQEFRWNDSSHTYRSCWCAKCADLIRKERRNNPNFWRPDRTKRICLDCNRELPIEQFKISNTKTGKRLSRCLDCYLPHERANALRWRNNNREEFNRRAREYRALHKNPDKNFEQSLASRYNLTINQYNALLEKQNFKCANTRCDEVFVASSKKRLYVDHDHKCCPAGRSCGKCVRGLLCHSCNSTLGHAKENENRLLGLVDYIRSFT